MSLPLRHGLENVSSIDRVLEDLLVRFIINCPPEDLSSVERELFHFEEASWFYTDFVKLMNQNLPSLKIKSISQLFIKLCPLIWKWDIKADEALAKFSKYKKTIPVRGAAIFNENLNKILLVKGTESDSWSFPRGKISKDENDVDCCIREVKEEIGFDITDYIDEEQFIERNITGKNYKIFLIKNVQETINFRPLVRNEIAKIQWFDFKTVSKNIFKSNNNNNNGSNFKYYLINSMMRPLSMWLRHQRQIKNEGQLKQFAEEQLKLLLGITKEEQIDPGRELLNMLHTAVHNKQPISIDSNENKATDEGHRNVPADQLSSNNNNNIINVSNENFPINMVNNKIPQNAQLPININNGQIPQHIQPMGFQPFTPFPFANGNMPFSVPPIPINQLPVAPPQSFPNGVNGGFPPNRNFPSTPNINALSRPSLVTAEPPSDNSKELLNLLHTKKESVIEEKPKVKILQRNSNTNNVNDSNVLLNLLHSNNNESNPKESNESKSSTLLNMLKSNNHMSSNVPPPTDNNEGNDNGYISFEDSTEEEDTDNISLQSDIEAEKLEKLDEYKSIHSFNKEILQENIFEDGDVPHKEVTSESAKSVRSSKFSTASPVSHNTITKPKIKLLKRGETFEDIKNDNKKQSNDLLNMIRKDNSHEIVASPPAPEVSISSTNNELMEMLRRNSESKSPNAIELEPVPLKNKADSSNNELLNILKRNTNPQLQQQQQQQQQNNTTVTSNQNPVLNMVREHSLSPTSMSPPTRMNMMDSNVNSNGSFNNSFKKNFGNTFGTDDSRQNEPFNSFASPSPPAAIDNSKILLSMLHKPRAQDVPHGQSLSQRSKNTNDELMQMLQKNSQPSTVNMPGNSSDSTNLLNLLHKQGTDTQQNDNGSSQLLNMLKKPSGNFQ